MLAIVLALLGMQRVRLVRKRLRIQQLGVSLRFDADGLSKHALPVLAKLFLVERDEVGNFGFVGGCLRDRIPVVGVIGYGLIWIPIAVIAKASLRANHS